MIKHLACIMDGNRRWARAQGLALLRGHREGADTVKTVTQFCLKHKIPYLSLYTFSIENFKRSEQEKQYLFDLIVHESPAKIAEFIENNVRVRIIGQRSLFPANVQQACQELEEKTAHCTALTVHFLLGYGGRQEIVSCVAAIAQDVRDGRIAAADITDDLVYKRLWLGDVPEPELVIRTGGVKRLSNFLIYQIAYSELYFLDCMWPDMTMQHFEDALAYYHGVQRRFGA